MMSCDKLKKFRDDFAFMRDLTVTTRREQGVSVCREDTEEFLGPKCSGERCAVKIAPCPEEAVEVATVHFHPSPFEFDLFPSPIDVLDAGEDEPLSCIGNFGDKIACYDLRDINPARIEAAETEWVKCSRKWGEKQPESAYYATKYESLEDFPEPVRMTIVEKCSPDFMREVQDILSPHKKCELRL